MFGRQSHSSGSGSSNLVEFRAGKMNMIGTMVHPDTRKGTVYMTQSDDGLMHFCWKDRTSGKVEDDLIVFPDDFEFKRVEQCKTGRVYVLKFKTSSRRMFFWMQETKTDKDEEWCRRVNELMNNPPSSQRGGGSSNDSGDLQYMLNNMSQQQLMQLFGGVGQMGGLSSLLGSMNRNSDSSRTSSTPTANRSSGSSSALFTPENTVVPRTPSAPKSKGTKSSIAEKYSANTTATPSTGGASGSTGASGGGTTVIKDDADNLDLSGAITSSEAINELIADPEIANVLSVHLPKLDDKDEDKKKQIQDTIASAQFQQALTSFSNALQSAQLGPVVSQFELPPEAVAAAFSGNVEDFVKALEKLLPAGATMPAAAASPAKESTSKDKAAVDEDQEMKSSEPEKKEE